MRAFFLDTYYVESFLEAVWLRMPAAPNPATVGDTHERTAPAVSRHPTTCAKTRVYTYTKVDMYRQMKNVCINVIPMRIHMHRDMYAYLHVYASSYVQTPCLEAVGREHNSRGATPSRRVWSI